MWWEKTENGYHFFDGDEDLETHSEGPLLLHHRSVLLEEVRKQQRAAWKFILDRGIPLPTPRLYLYDEDGNPLQNQHSGDQSTVHLYSTNDESTHRNPNSDKTIASHPTEDQIITSYPTDGHTTASHSTDVHTIASHPTDDQTIASQCSGHQTSRDSQNNSTESSHCLQENSDTDPILEFRNSSNSIQDGQTDTC